MMNIFKRLFSKEKDGVTITVKKVKLEEGECICTMNSKGRSVSGWCREHHTDWL